jgi:hypothetical protein
MADENKVSSISKARSIEEMAEFWDTHSLADYEDEMYEVEMTFDPAARQNYVSIESELMQELRRIAHTRKVSTQTLINVWLRKDVDELHLQAQSAD